MAENRTTDPATRDPDCVFCRIIAGELPGTFVARTDRAVAFMDIAPATRGHVLVVPVRHAPDLMAAEPDDVTAVALLAQDIARRATKRLGADGVNLFQSSGAAAWQEVFHLHVHVVPRYVGDPLVLPWSGRAGDPEQIRAAATELGG
ncbi:MAG TPA: HIT family protein [Actinopolymorphaceae bacterium]